ncbi:MAG TPA: hypothetical protein VLD57_04495, partial [Blastocatellia bacterium]|nr:hypothetical protein [Blastocatellia bacterium]
SVPLGEQKEATLDDEQTLVRPRRQTPVATSGLKDPDHITLDEPTELARPASVVYRDRSAADRGGSGWGWALAIIFLLFVAAGAAYVMFGDRLLGRGSQSAVVIEAQQSVTDALARIDSLPKDHTLRAYLPQLAQWQGELRAYGEVGKYSPEIVNRAEHYRLRAEEIAGQARLAAQADRVVAPVANSNITVPPQGDIRNDAEPGEEETSEEEGKARNSNTAKPRRADPPVLEPVRPVPPQQPANSNRPRPSPPAVESIKPQ